MRRSGRRRLDDDAAISLVRNFFSAFDSRDYAAMEAAFLPGATLVHDNGVMTSLPEMMQIIRTTSGWPPRERELSGFKIRWVGEVAIAGLRNRVTFRPTDRAPTTSTYTETWVLERTPAGLKTVRVHYSLVTAERHSEEVP